MRISALPLLLPLCIMASPLLGCGDDDDGTSSDVASIGADAAAPGSVLLDAGLNAGDGTLSGDGAVPQATGDGNTTASGSAAPPLYAMMIQVYSTEDRTVYVHLSNTLDIGANIDLAKTREFPSVANFAGIAGRILVSSGVEPSITEYDIGADLSWKAGRTVNFSNYPHEDNANFYAQFILDDNTAYLPFDVTSRILWNPTTMSITKVLEDTQLPAMKSGLKAGAGGNRIGIRYKGPVQQAFFYTDENDFAFDQESVVAIYDPQTHAEKSLVTLPCPGLSIPSQDEEGYTYYGTWSFQERALFNEGPKPCYARLKPDLTVDTAWTTDLRDLTGGLYSNNLRYIGNGRAVANVLDHTKLGLDFTNGYKAEVAEKFNAYGPHWSVWLFDLKKREGKRIEGIDVATGSGSQFAVIDGRTFLFVPYQEWGRTKIYEILADGSAKLHSDTAGDVFKWVKIR